MNKWKREMFYSTLVGGYLTCTAWSKVKIVPHMHDDYTWKSGGTFPTIQKKCWWEKIIYNNGEECTTTAFENATSTEPLLSQNLSLQLFFL